LSLGYGASWPSYQKKGFLEPYVAEIKGVVGIPVMMVGAMHFFEIAERILGEGKADFIVMARGLIADPEIPRKLSEGRSEDVRRCIRCNECLTRTTGYVPVTCTINPAAAKENRRQIIKADKAKKVLVIGGGPAGMEAARVAALRGHEVTLFEKADRLGGNMIPASIPDFKEEIRYLREWYIGQLTKLTVRIELNREATPDLVVGRKADVAIVATGARPFIPEIPGIEQAPGAIEVLLGQKIVGSEVVVAGGGLVGCETALYLAQQGKKVIVLARRDDILFDANPIMKATLIEKLVEQKIKWLTNVKLEEVKKREAVAVDRNWERHSFSGDTVLAWGMIPENSLIRLLKGKIREVYPIGDCAEPRTFLHAIHEGYRIANRI
jgi:2-enoate reductase